jgi:hypothetical protein
MARDQISDAHVQAVFHAYNDGIRALTDGERARYREVEEFARHSWKHVPPEQLTRLHSSFGLPRRIEPWSNERELDWRPDELWALLLLVDDRTSRF